MVRRTIVKRLAAVLGLATCVATMLVAPAAPAVASPADCDATNVLGIHRTIDGASFNNLGRRVELQQEAVLDTYHKARIVSGRQTGDQVWVDRSINSVSGGGRYPSTADVIASGGWKQCGPFTAIQSNWVQTPPIFDRAARACYRPSGGSSVCGSWFVDR